MYRWLPVRVTRSETKWRDKNRTACRASTPRRCAGSDRVWVSRAKARTYRRIGHLPDVTSRSLTASVAPAGLENARIEEEVRCTLTCRSANPARRPRVSGGGSAAEPGRSRHPSGRPPTLGTDTAQHRGPTRSGPAESRPGPGGKLPRLRVPQIHLALGVVEGQASSRRTSQRGLPPLRPFVCRTRSNPCASKSRTVPT